MSKKNIHANLYKENTVYVRKCNIWSWMYHNYIVIQLDLTSAAQS